MRRSKVFLGCMAFVVTAQACASRQPRQAPDKPVANAPPIERPAPLELPNPARYVLTESQGITYDEVGDSSPIAGRDFAIASGIRLIVEGGLIVESTPSPEPLMGFSSLPARLGGGFVFWSDSRVYRAASFLGKLEPFAAVAASGGVRPWFDSFVLRTPLGLLEVDPKSLAVRRTDLARFSELRALDAQVGIRLDTTGRTEISNDGGKTYRDLTTEQGRRFFVPLVTTSDKLHLSSNGFDDQHFLLDKTGTLTPFDPWTTSTVRLEVPTPMIPPEEPATTRRLAPVDLVSAIVAGAYLPGQRVVVAREMSLRILSAKTGQFVQDLSLTSSQDRFTRCQPVFLTDELQLACTHPRGAHLFKVQESPSRHRLSATFPETNLFVAGIGKRFAFLGRCGSQPPALTDFGETIVPPDPANTADPSSPPEPPQPDTSEPLPSRPEDEAAVCVRRADGTWVEHRLDGEDARHLHLFLPDDDGRAVALVLRNPGEDKPVQDKPDGLRIIRLDRKDLRLRNKSFLPPIKPLDMPPYRSIQNDFWLDEKDGSIHGWVTIDPASEDDESAGESESEETPDAATPRMTGPMAGLRIAKDGSFEVYPIPTGVTDVVWGGAYGFARAEAETGPKYYETTDGGRTFVEVAGPPVGDFSESQGDTDLRGCSIVGCALGGGLIRLGWHGPPAAPPTSTESDDTLSKKVFDPETLLPPKSLRGIKCRVEDRKEDKHTTDKTIPLPITLLAYRGMDIGNVRDHKWSALATTPFELRQPHRVDFQNVLLDKLDGSTLPLLTASATSPVNLIFRANPWRFDLAPGPGRAPVSMPTDVFGSIGAQVDRDRFVIWDSRRSELVMVQDKVARTVLRIGRIADVARDAVVLARRAGTGDDVLALAVVRSDSGEILLGDIDLGRGTVGPLRVAANVRSLDVGSACKRGARDHRLIFSEVFAVQFEAPDDTTRGGFSGETLISVGSGRGCREASEMHMALANEGTLVIRYAEGSSPALIHERGGSLRARCISE